MKTHFLSWTIAIMVASVALVKPASENKAAAKNTHNISLNIYKENDYNQDVYKNTFVQVKVSIDKVNGNNRSSVWSKTFLPTELASLPAMNEAISQNLKVNGVKKGNEHLEVVYSLSYNTNGQELILEGSQIVNDHNESVNIGI